MPRLIIEAPYGVEYLAWARLEDASGCQLSRGAAVLKARPGFCDVPQGRYTLRQLLSFPKQPMVRKEFGEQGLIFQWIPSHQHGQILDVSAHPLLLVHGGTLQDGGMIQGTCGAIRLEQLVLDTLVSLAREWRRAAGTLAQWPLELEVRIEKGSAAGDVWAQPSARQRVSAERVGLDFETVLSHPQDHEISNAAVAWLAYLDQGQQADNESGQAEAAFSSRQGGDFGGGGVSGSWGNGVAADTGGRAQTDAAPQEALFDVQPLPGVDSKGRVVDVQYEPSWPDTATVTQTTSYHTDDRSSAQAGASAQTEINTTY